jgi:hypothetical protein
MEQPQPHIPPAEPTHDPPPLHPSPDVPEPPPQPSPGQPEPGPRPVHDPPLYPEHDRAAAKPFIPDAWTPDLPLDEVVFDESRVPPEVGSNDQVQQTLDEALANSFPASDPVSIVTSQHEEAWKKDR